LPSSWTPETLKEEHTSEPFNPLIFKMFFWVGEVEEVGSGTNKIISWCKEWELPEPEFGISGTSIFVRIRKDILTVEYLKGLGLNERQIKAVMYVKERGKITNREYQRNFSVSRQTATRDLTELVNKGILILRGTGKRNAHYTILEAKMRHKIGKRGKKEAKN